MLMGVSDVGRLLQWVGLGFVENVRVVSGMKAVTDVPLYVYVCALWYSLSQ